MAPCELSQTFTLCRSPRAIWQAPPAPRQAVAPMHRLVVLLLRLAAFLPQLSLQLLPCGRSPHRPWIQDAQSIRPPREEDLSHNKSEDFPLLGQDPTRAPETD